MKKLYQNTCKKCGRASGGKYYCKKHDIYKTKSYFTAYNIKKESEEYYKRFEELNEI